MLKFLVCMHVLPHSSKVDTNLISSHNHNKITSNDINMPIAN
jgi:hypothetical protein